MPRIPINPERYRALLDAFILLGPRFGAVARHTGTTPETARKAWEKGWPEASFAPPIASIYAEHLKQRKMALSGTLVTRRVDESDALSQEGPGQRDIRLLALDAETLKSHAVEALRQEMIVLQRIRDTGSGLLDSSERIVKAFAAMANSVAENMLVASQNVAAATPDALLNPLEKFARCIDMLSVTQERVMKMQRLLVGAPQQIVENRGPVAPSGEGEGIALGERLARLTALLQSAGVVPTGQGPERYRGEESNAEHPADPAMSQAQDAAVVQDDAQGKPWPNPEPNTG